LIFLMALVLTSRRPFCHWRFTARGSPKAMRTWSPAGDSSAFSPTQRGGQWKYRFASSKSCLGRSRLNSILTYNGTRRARSGFLGGFLRWFEEHIASLASTGELDRILADPTRRLADVPFRLIE